MKRLVAGLWMLAWIVPTVAVADGGPRPLTAEEAIETTRFMLNPGAEGPANPDGAVAVSPDGKRYVARLVRGDVQRNGVWMELITGGLDSLESAVAYRTVARLFTSGRGSRYGINGPNRDTEAHASPLRWLDETHVTFLWSDEHDNRQVVRVDLQAQRVEFLTRHPSPIVAFDVSRAGVVLYNATARRQARTAGDPLKDGIVIGENVDAYSLFRGDLESGGLFDNAWNTEWFLQRPSMSHPQALRIAGRDIDLDTHHRIAFSPDGKLAVANAAPGEIPAGWDAYEAEMRERIAEARRDPRDADARLVHQHFLVDLGTGESRPLWNAVTLIFQTKVAWSADSRSVLLAPTFLPPEQATAAGLRGQAAAVVDAASGRFELVPVELSHRVEAVRWTGADRIEIDERHGRALWRYRFERNDGRWELVDRNTVEPDMAVPVRIELRQDLNTPPRLFAVEVATGRERLILDPNPRLTQDFALGRVERIEGALSEGARWEGLLFYPVGYEPGRRYPLVIQSQYGRPLQDEFTLYGFQRGAGLGPTLIAPYAAQLLAGRGIAVLELDVPEGHRFSTAAEAAVRRDAFEAAARQLIDSGLVDPARVGLAGFSRNGYYVEYTLSHSDFPFAAAIAADNWDPGYFHETLTGYSVQATAVNGAPPFGEGLQAWLAQAPGFNAEKIRTPLRMVEQSSGLFGVLLKWEIFNRLRYLKRPVEFYVMPDAEHGSHSPQNPAQIIAVQQGTVDWFDFWLNDREDPSPEKREQYARWRRLRQLHEEALRAGHSSPPGR